ncbi:4a-hydroxytetrahydrobiopterin dehydratase [Naumannella huperziae]
MTSNSADAAAFDPSELERLGLADWTYAGGVLKARYDTGDFRTAVRLLDAVADAADAADHHPDVTLGYGRIDFALHSHDQGAVTERDTALAATISGLAAEQGVSREGGSLSFRAGEAVPSAAVPFWLAVLRGPNPPAGEELVIGDDHEVVKITGDDGQGRFRVNVTVDAGDAPGDLVRATLEARGSLVSDEYAPNWWLVADPVGNQARICGQTEGLPPLAQDGPLAR